MKGRIQESESRIQKEEAANHFYFVITQAALAAG
jgi:hypothetical protein